MKILGELQVTAKYSGHTLYFIYWKVAYFIGQKMVTAHKVRVEVDCDLHRIPPSITKCLRIPCMATIKDYTAVLHVGFIQIPLSSASGTYYTGCCQQRA